MHGRENSRCFIIIIHDCASRNNEFLYLHCGSDMTLYTSYLSFSLLVSFQTVCGFLFFPLLCGLSMSRNIIIIIIITHSINQPALLFYVSLFSSFLLQDLSSCSGTDLFEYCFFTCYMPVVPFLHFSSSFSFHNNVRTPSIHLSIYSILLKKWFQMRDEVRHPFSRCFIFLFLVLALYVC